MHFLGFSVLYDIALTLQLYKLLFHNYGPFWENLQWRQLWNDNCTRSHLNNSRSLGAGNPRFGIKIVLSPNASSKQKLHFSNLDHNDQIDLEICGFNFNLDLNNDQIVIEICGVLILILIIIMIRLFLRYVVFYAGKVSDPERYTVSLRWFTLYNALAEEDALILVLVRRPIRWSLYIVIWISVVTISPLR